MMGEVVDRPGQVRRRRPAVLPSAFAVALVVAVAPSPGPPPGPDPGSAHRVDAMEQVLRVG